MDVDFVAEELQKLNQQKQVNYCRQNQKYYKSAKGNTIHLPEQKKKK